MALLDKVALQMLRQKRAENAAKRMLQNKEKKGFLTEDQHDALANLARVRHNLHSNLEALAHGTDSGRDIERDLIRANNRLYEQGIPVEGIPYDEADYFEIDNLDDERNFAHDNGTELSAEDEDEIVANALREWDKVNFRIEDYLRKIDEQNGTDYAPTGAQRF